MVLKANKREERRREEKRREGTTWGRRGKALRGMLV